MHWLSQSKTNGRYHAFAAPSRARDWHGGPFPTHGGLAQGLSLTMRPTRTASPYVFLTAVTRNLAIARFLCEYSGPFWGMFSKIRLDLYLSIYLPTWSYENRLSKHFVIFLNFPCLIACLLCCLLMSFFFFWLVLWLRICVEVDVDRIPVSPAPPSQFFSLPTILSLTQVTVISLKSAGA